MRKRTTLGLSTFAIVLALSLSPLAGYAGIFDHLKGGPPTELRAGRPDDRPHPERRSSTRAPSSSSSPTSGARPG